MEKNILSLDSKKAEDFFLTSTQYHGFELPEYFVFDEMLQRVRTSIGDTPYEECLREGVLPDELPDVNLDILLNKDGRYAVRPIMLANPFLYCFLVREICSSWTLIKALFEKFRVPHIMSCAIPVIPRKKEPFHKSTTILHWWSSVEQRSIELSLEYRYMFVTDITNCYGTVNPQTIDWAFNLKGTAFEHPCEVPIAGNIRKYLSAFQQGRNIGIPQGSAVFDLLGEIVLGYSDLLLHEAIMREGITADYEIIRYRDDYRVFCNDKDSLEKISYILQHVLESLNFRMNSQKTRISESIVTDAVKPDKLFYIFNTPIFSKKGVDFDSFEKHLLYILMFSRKYPDSGSIKTMLSDLDKRLEDWLKQKAEEAKIGPVLLGVEEANDSSAGKRKGVIGDEIPGGSVRALAAVCAQIALENVNCSHYALRVLSRMVDALRDEEKKWTIIGLVHAKLSKQPNSAYTQLWLQNITYQQDRKNGVSPYHIRLCKVVMGEDVTLWNNSWLKDPLTEGFSQTGIVNRETLAKVTPVITFRERRSYTESEEDFIERKLEIMSALGAI